MQGHPIFNMCKKEVVLPSYLSQNGHYNQKPYKNDFKYDVFFVIIFL